MTEVVKCSPATKPRVCLVTAGGDHPAIIANALSDAFGSIDVIVEMPEGKVDFLRRRSRLSGFVSTGGQFVTMLLIVTMKRLFVSRIRALTTELAVNVDFQPEHRLTRVSSVNAPEFIEAISRLKPDVILLCGCRIMRIDIISQMPAPVLNYHAGITPLYRGMNGGYWALAQGDAANFGATVHLVDAGVDTGQIVGQVRLAPSSTDAIWTYAYRQAAASRKLCVDCVREAAEGSLVRQPTEGESRQWFHPPIWAYIWTGVRKGVW